MSDDREAPTEVTVSATQIDTYELCQRKWGFLKLDGLEAPPNKYAKRGLGVHKVLEGWLDKGVPIDTSTEYGKIAAPGLKHLPPPGSGLIEHQFRLSTDDGIVYVGLMDVLQLLSDRVRIWDHKTTVDLRYAKSPVELAKNVQAMLYAGAARAMRAAKGQDPDVPIELSWVYYRASEKKPGSKVVKLHVIPDGHTLPLHEDAVSHSHLEEQLDRIHKVALTLADHRRSGKTALDMKPNVEACHAFGGCPFRGNPCKLNPQQLLRGIMTQSSLIERMKAAKAAQKGGTEGDAPAAPSADSQASQDAKDAAAETVAAAQQPAVNPPEEPKGPPATAPRAQERERVLERMPLRASMAATIASGLLARGGSGNAKAIAKQAVDIVNEIEGAL